MKIKYSISAPLKIKHLINNEIKKVFGTGKNNIHSIVVNINRSSKPNLKDLNKVGIDIILDFYSSISRPLNDFSLLHSLLKNDNIRLQSIYGHDNEKSNNITFRLIASEEIL